MKYFPHRCYYHVWRGAVYLWRGRGLCEECLKREIRIP